ncbi:MAG: flagellin lysine-N-methylase [Fibrobacter sp.]|nr:flagellin lysine-N-methylase [Fibrobacter sp.]
MVLRVPSFYKDFKCLADKCTDTCCAGWEVCIDEETLSKYAKVGGEFGNRLRENIEGGCFKLRPGDRCPFLDSRNLCEIHRHLGPEYLCDICREHPRFVEVYGDVMEKGIGLCCEEGVRLLLESPGMLDLEEREVDEPADEISENAVLARDAIFAERDWMLGLLASTAQGTAPARGILPERALREGLHQILDATSPDEPSPANPNQITDKVNLSEGEILVAWKNILNAGESFGPAWDRALTKLDEASQNLFSAVDGAKIVAYTLFRYYGKTLFDGDALTKVKFAVFFWLVLKRFGAAFGTNKIDAVKLLSKQVEYSDEVMEILSRAFAEDPAFSVPSFHRMVDLI